MKSSNKKSLSYQIIVTIVVLILNLSIKKSEAIPVISSKLVFLHEEHHHQQKSIRSFQNSEIMEKSSVFLMNKIRGGDISSGSNNKAILSFGQSLTGQIFSFGCVMYGLACFLAPKGCANLFYGVNIENNEENKEFSYSITHHNRILLLMKMIGFVTLGIGLTASFSIASDLRLFNNNGLLSFYKAVGIGLVPRLLFLIHQLLLPTATYVGSTLITKVDVWVCFIETVLFLLSLYGTVKAITPEFPILLESVLCLFFGPVLFFRPKLLFDVANQEGQEVSKYEKLLTRLLATYLLSSAVLVLSLQLLDGSNQHVTGAIEAIGFTALTWVASLVHITFIRKDLLECKCSFLTHVIIIGIGLAVSAGGLHSFLS